MESGRCSHEMSCGRSPYSQEQEPQLTRITWLSLVARSVGMLRKHSPFYLDLLPRKSYLYRPGLFGASRLPFVWIH